MKFLLLTWLIFFIFFLGDLWEFILLSCVEREGQITIVSSKTRGRVFFGGGKNVMSVTHTAYDTGIDHERWKGGQGWITVSVPVLYCTGKQRTFTPTGPVRLPKTVPVSKGLLRPTGPVRLLKWSLSFHRVSLTCWVSLEFVLSLCLFRYKPVVRFELWSVSGM